MGTTRLGVGDGPVLLAVTTTIVERAVLLGGAGGVVELDEGQGGRRLRELLAGGAEGGVVAVAHDGAVELAAAVVPTHAVGGAVPGVPGAHEQVGPGVAGVEAGRHAHVV